MGIFDTLLGGKSGATSSTSGTTAQTGGSSQSQSGSSSQTATGSTQVLDDDTIAVLQGILPQLAGAVGGEGSGNADVLANISNLLVNAGSGTDINAQILAAQNEATRQFKLGQGSAISNLQQQIGSKGNTFSALVEQQGSADLATMLAALDADVRSRAREQSLAELLGGADAASRSASVGIAEQSAPIQDLLAVVAGLKGAKTTSESDVTSIESLLSSLTSQSTGTVDETTTGSQNSRPGILQSIVGLFK